MYFHAVLPYTPNDAERSGTSDHERLLAAMLDDHGGIILNGFRNVILMGDQRWRPPQVYEQSPKLDRRYRQAEFVCSTVDRGL